MENNKSDYSRAKYDEANRDACMAEQILIKSTKKLIGRVKAGDEEIKRYYDSLLLQASHLRAEVEKLYGKSQIEANAINEKYDQLQYNVIDAVDALAKFERKKLGMDKEDTIFSELMSNGSPLLMSDSKSKFTDNQAKKTFFDDLWKKIGDAGSQLGKLSENDYADAVALNREHDELRRKVEKATENLVRFEQDIIDFKEEIPI